MAEQEDLTGDLSLVDHNRLQERLRQSKKQRSLQLKAYEQYEKRLSKQQLSVDKKLFNRRSKKDPIDLKSQRSSKIIFGDGVLMMDIIARKDIPELKRLLIAGVNPDVTGIDGLTGLHQSCIDNALDIVCLLVEYGANVNARDTEMWTPLHAAATCGHLGLCRYLCEHGADLLAMNSDGNMPYDLCEDPVTLDYIETTMTKQGVTQELIDETRMCTENQMLTDLQKLYDRGGSLEGRGDSGETLLHIAACCGYTRVVQFLISHKVQLDVVDNDSWQPIHCAGYWAQAPVVELLLLNGIDSNVKNDVGETVLDLCEDIEVKQNIVEIIEMVRNRHKKLIQESGAHLAERRRSSARRSSIASPASIAWQRRSSVHERRDSISLREMREESQRLQESMLLSVSAEEEDDEDEKLSEPPVTITVTTPENDTADNAPSTAPVEEVGSGGKSHPLARALSCPPPSSSDISSVVNGHEPETKRLKSIIKKTMSNGNTYFQSGDVLAAGDSTQGADYRKQTSLSSKSSVGSDRKGLHGKGCCVVS